MTQPVEIFYTFECPYSYLAIDRLSELDQKFDIQVLWQPYSARATGKNAGGFAVQNDRQSYIREDVVRLAKHMNMPLVMKASWPEECFDPERSTRGAIVASDLGISMEYNIKMFYRWWGEGENPDDQSFFVELCDDLDVDPNEFSGRINSSDVRERARGIYKRGRKLNIFDTPMVVIGEERFNGLDRICAVEGRLKELGLSK